MALEGSAATLAARGETALAVTLFSAAGAIREMTGTPLTAVERAEYDAILEEARLTLGPAFTLAQDRGTTLTAERAAALVLDPVTNR
jgi:hypothetical protein